LTAGDNLDLIFIASFSPFFSAGNNFDIDFDFSGAPSRVFESGDLRGFNGIQSLGLPGNSYGARFVYGQPFPVDPPTGVPDNGASALLLTAGLAGLSLLRRTVV
jgi:hypothetical protein